MNGWIDTWTDRQPGGQTDRYVGKPTDKQTDISYMYIYIYIYCRQTIIPKQTESYRQIHKQSDRHKYGQIGKKLQQIDVKIGAVCIIWATGPSS